jgi:ketosteroid isomerase-like protein
MGILNVNKLVLLLSMCALSASCSPNMVQQPPPPPVDWHSLDAVPLAAANNFRATDKERSAADRYTKALMSTGMAQLGQVLDERAHFAFGTKDVLGRQNVVSAHESLFGAFDDRKFVVTRCWATESSQAVEWTMTGLHAREWLGLATTNHPIVIRGLTLLSTKDDGSVSDIRVYFDEEAAKESLGRLQTDNDNHAGAVASGSAQLFERTGSPDEATNVTVVRGALDALENGQESDYLSSMAEALETSTLQHGEPFRGKSGARAYYRMMRRSIGHLDTLIDAVWAAGDYVIVEYSISGVQLAKLGSIALLPDRVLRMKLVDVAEVRDAKIVRIWRYDNPGAFVTP